MQQKSLEFSLFWIKGYTHSQYVVSTEQKADAKKTEMFFVQNPTGFEESLWHTSLLLTLTLTPRTRASPIVVSRGCMIFSYDERVQLQFFPLTLTLTSTLTQTWALFFMISMDIFKNRPHSSWGKILPRPGPATCPSAKQTVSEGRECTWYQYTKVHGILLWCLTPETRNLTSKKRKK